MDCQLNSKTQEIAWAKDVAQFARTQNANDAADAIEQLIRDYDNRKITVALIGLNKRGKSTLCNALLGRKDDTLAPIAWDPATNVISTFANHDAIPEADRDTDSGATERAFVHFEDDTRKEISCREIRNYVMEEHNPGNRKNVDHLEIYGDFAMDKDVVLQDLPGDDSLYAYHSQIVYQYLPNADIVIFLSSATDPIQQSEFELLQKVAEGERRKLFFVINKADVCEDDELEEAKQHNRGVLQNAGISYEKRLFCISAKQMMEEGKDDYEFGMLSREIQDYLNANKLELLREGFRNSVRMAVADLEAQLKLRIDANKMSAEELQTSIERLQEGKARCLEILKHGLDQFLRDWKMMLDVFEAKLPELEANTQQEVRMYIENIPMMDLNQKTVTKIPPKIEEILTREFQGALVELETQVKKNLSDLEHKMNDINEYFVGNIPVMKYSKEWNSHIGSLISGGVFMTLGGGLLTVATLPGTLVAIPLIGEFLAAAGGIITAPLLALSAPILLAGTALLAIPFYSFVRGKKHSKNEILKDAETQLKKAFAEIRVNKLEILRLKGERLYTELERSFRKKMEQTQEQLDQVLLQKRQAIPQGNETLMLEEISASLAGLLQTK